MICLGRLSLLLGCLALWYAGGALGERQLHEGFASSITKPTRTDLYGDSLPPGAAARLGTLRLRIPPNGASLALSPDGKTLITSGWDGAAVWDTTTGRIVRRLGADMPKPPVGPVSLSADGKLVAVGGEIGAVFELATGRPIIAFGRQNNYVSPSLSPDGKLLAAYYSRDFTIELYNAANGKLIHTLEMPEVKPGRVYPHATGAAFTPDNKILISAGGDGVIRFWDVITGKEQRQIIPETPEVTKIALSPDGSLLASVGLKFAPGKDKGVTHYFTDDRVSLWDVASGKKMRDISVPDNVNLMHHVGPASIAFGPDGKTLWTGGSDQSLTIWDVATGMEVRRFTDHSGLLAAVAIAPSGKTFAVADCGMAIRIRDVASGRDLSPTIGQRSTILAVAASPDGRQVATGSADRTIYLWELPTGRELRRLADIVNIDNLVYSRDGRVLFCACYQILRAFELSTGKELWRFEDKERIGATLALSPDAKKLASVGGRSRTILLIDSTTGKEIRKLVAPGFYVDAIAFSPDGETLLACSASKNLDRWEIATGKHIDRSDLAPRRVDRITFSLDGRLAALAAMDFKMHMFVIEVLDVSTYKQICRFPKGRDYPPVRPSCMAFSPDDRTLAWSGQSDSLVHVVEVATGQERCQFAGHRGMIYSLAFSNDGKFLVSGAGDTTALVWDLTGRLASEKNGFGALTDSKLPSCWEFLQSEDAARAYTVMKKLMEDPSRSVPHLRKRLHPVAGMESLRLERFIAELDSNQFAVRQKATEELENLGEPAQPALEKALASKPSPEVKKRAEALLEKLRTPITSGPKLQALRAIEVLEHIGTPEAQEVLHTLAKGAPEALVTREAKASLDRLSKLAARKP